MARRQRVLLWSILAVPLAYAAILLLAVATGNAGAAHTIIDETRQWWQILQR